MSQKSVAEEGNSSPSPSGDIASSPEAFYDAKEEQNFGTDEVDEAGNQNQLREGINKIKFSLGAPEDDLQFRRACGDVKRSGVGSQNQSKSKEMLRKHGITYPPPRSLPIDILPPQRTPNRSLPDPEAIREVEECLKIYKSEHGAKYLSDEEVMSLVKAKHIPAYQLEKAVDDMERGVRIR